MPSKPRPYEKRLLSLFLSRYEDGSWRDFDPDWKDEKEDYAVELVATRRSDGRTVAIEHTLIQVTVRDTEDAEHSKPLLRLRDDPSLVVPGRIVYVYVPVGTVQKGFEDANVAELHSWLVANRLTLPVGWSTHSCAFSGKHRPPRTLRVRVVPTEKAHGNLLVLRYGNHTLDKTVGKALKSKVPKLVRTEANQRILLLEHRAWSLDYMNILKEIERQRPNVPELSKVDEIWLAETVPVEDIVMFSLYEGGLLRRNYVFLNGTLTEESINGMPVQVPRE